MSIEQIFTILYRQRKTAVICAAAVFGAVLLVTLFSPMLFQARGSLYLGELQDARPSPGPVPEQLDFLGGRSEQVGTEIEILKSQTLIKRAVLASGLNVSLAPRGWSPPRYWRWRLGGRSPALLDAGAGRVLATGATLAGGEAKAKFAVRFGAGGHYAVARGSRPLGSGTLGAPFKGGGLSVTLLAGPEGSPAPGALFDLVVTSADDVAEGAARTLSITLPRAAAGETVKVVSVEYRDASPRASAAFVAALMRAYLDSRQGWRMEEATAAEKFMTGQAQAIERELAQAEKRLAEYGAQSPVVALGEESKILGYELSKYGEQRVAARLQVAAFDRVREALSTRDMPIEGFMIGEKEDPVLASLSNDLAQARQLLRQTEERFTAEAPATIEQKALVASQLKMLKSYVAGRAARAQKELESLDETIAQFEDKLKTVPAAQLELTRLTRDAEALRKVHAVLLERRQQAAVTKASTISRSRVLDPPATPLRERSPALLFRLTLGALLGLLLGGVVVIGRWALSPRIQSETQALRALGELRVLAAIPEQQVPAGKAPHTAPAVAEAFRHLRTSIYCDSAGLNQVVVITSPSPGDGKTLCTLALASALTADGKRVLLIEADMHRPTLGKLLGLRPGAELGDLLAGRQSWPDVVSSVPVGGACFDVVPVHTPCADSAELLSGQRFTEMLALARTAYDFVLVDSPPFPLLSDALILSLQADRVLSVLRLGNTARPAAQKHLQGLAAATARHGVIVNGAVADAAAQAYYQQNAA